MGKAFGIFLVIVIATAGLAYGARVYATHAMSNRAVTPKPLGSTTPASAGLPFSRVAIESRNRTLIGWWVRARADSGNVAPAVLFLHGNRSSISDYISLQKFLYKQGVSSLVFDYSGFGASGGSASLNNAVSDAGIVARVFEDSAGKNARRIALGTALGSTVLLQAIDSVQPHVNGVVIEGVAASVRESAVRDGRLPKMLAPLVEDIGDNVTAAKNVRVPLLAVHSYADNRFPFDDAQRVVAAVPSRTSLVRHWRKGHSALLTSTRPCDWAPVLTFVKAGKLPAAKIDSTDACATQAQVANAAASKATVTPAGNAATATGSKSSAKKTPATKARSTATKASSTATKAPSTKAPATKTKSTPPKKPSATKPR
jgi:pimeloyl-ACP methyl ester carboxylesterase